MSKVSVKTSRTAVIIKTLHKLRQALFTRSSIANLMMLSFILFTAVGAGMIYLPAGFIAVGVASGVFGLLLGSE